MIYLDNAATSFPKPETVYRALDEFGRQHLANPGRAGHKMALASERLLDDARHLLTFLSEHPKQAKQGYSKSLTGLLRPEPRPTGFGHRRDSDETYP